MDYPIARHPWNRLVYAKWTDRVIAISEAVREALVKFGLPPERVPLVPSGIEVERFDPDRDARSARALVGFPEVGEDLLCVASLHPRKDHETLLRAFAGLRSRRPGVRLHLVGEGPRRARLEDFASRLGLDGHARFLGRRSDVPDLLAAADLFVLTPRFEGLGVAALEAMAAGRAVVATAVGGLRESVRDRETGRLVPPGDPEAVARALEELLADAAMRARLGRAARKWVEDRYSADEMARSTAAVYEEVLARRRPAR
jgi:glycosyltransferase involved in cell wall biosynthesis